MWYLMNTLLISGSKIITLAHIFDCHLKVKTPYPGELLSFRNVHLSQYPYPENKDKVKWIQWLKEHEFWCYCASFRESRVFALTWVVHWVAGRNWLRLLDLNNYTVRHQECFCNRGRMFQATSNNLKICRDPVRWCKEKEFCLPKVLTFVGSMIPAAIRSSYLPVAALYPNFTLSLASTCSEYRRLLKQLA